MTEYPILNCNPKSPSGGGWEEWLLVPAHAWQVLISCGREDSLNAFQRVVRNLMMTADYTIEQLSELTRFHPDLVTLLLESLHTEGILEKENGRCYRAPKVSGSKEFEEVPGGSTETGWILQNPWTGALYPTVLPHLPIQQVDGARAAPGRARLCFGDEAAPVRRDATALDYPNEVSVVPTAKDFFQVVAVRRSSEFKARSSALRSLPVKYDLQPDFEYDREFRSMKLITPTPTRVLLATTGIVLRDSPSDWHVCCPVGTGLSRDLRDHVIRLCNNDHRVASSFVRDLCDKTKHGEFRGWESFVRENEILGQRWTMAVFGPRIEDYPDVAAQLNVFHALSIRLKESIDNPAMCDIEAVCSCARKTVEALFKQFAKIRPFADLDAFLQGKNEEAHTDLALSWASQMGFSVEGVSDVMLVKKSWLRSSAKDPANFYSLRNVVGALLVQAWAQEDHPLRINALGEADFFTQMARLMELGNSSSHDNSHRPRGGTKTSGEDALSLQASLVHLIRMLLDPMNEQFTTIDHNHG